MAGALLGKGIAYPSRAPGFVHGVLGSHEFSFLCCVFF